MSGYNLITVLGPTASGKTLFGAHLAHLLNGEIISADSRQVYKGMDLGTGKDYADYQVKGSTIPVHLVDIHEAGYRYNLFHFQEDFRKSFEDIHTRRKIPLMVGGTGMYIESILKKYELVKVPPNQDLRDQLTDKNQQELIEILNNYHVGLHNTSDLKIRKRTIRAIEIADYYKRYPKTSDTFPDIRSIVLGIKYDRNFRRKRITQRLKARLKEGMMEEVRILLEKLPPGDLIYYGLEYKYLTLHLTGKLTFDDMFRKLEVAIHQFAKRQMTWFRKMERQGIDIHWMDGCMPIDEKISRSLEIIKQKAPGLIEKQ
jgi:tRNA dimethylallyltransferase